MTKIYKPEELVSRITDASKWAETFIDMFGSRTHEIDEGLMICWFANAMMTMYDSRNPEIDQLNDKLAVLEMAEAEANNYAQKTYKENKELQAKIVELETQLKQSQKKSDAFLAGRRCGKTNLVEKLVRDSIVGEKDKTKCPVCDKTIIDAGLFCSPECMDLHLKVMQISYNSDFNESRFRYTVPCDGILKINGTQQSGELVTKYGRYKLSNIVGIGIQVEKDDVIVVDKTLVTYIELE